MPLKLLGDLGILGHFRGLDDAGRDALDRFDFTRIVRNLNLGIIENLGISLQAHLPFLGRGDQL